MKKFIFIIIFVAIGLISPETKGADWKFFGYTNWPSTKDHAICFYDADSVKHFFFNSNARVWTYKIKQVDLLEVVKKNRNKIREEIGKKIENGYIPPYINLTSNQDFKNLSGLSEQNKEEYLDKLLCEVGATFSCSSYENTYLEINRKEKKFRILSTITSYNGRIESDNRPSKWMYFPPGSYMEFLLEIISN